MEKSSGSAGTKTSKKESKCCSAFAQEETLKPFIIVLALLGLVPLTGIMSVTFFAMELFEGNHLDPFTCSTKEISLIVP